MRHLVSAGELKKTRLRQGGLLTAQDTRDILDQRALGEQLDQEMQENGGLLGGAQAKKRHCGNCGKTGYNT